MNRSVLLLLGCFFYGLAIGQFAPPAGQIGTTAIHKDSTIIVAWATGVQVRRGYINIADTNQVHEGSNRASFGIPENALGAAEGTSDGVVSLGDGGEAILTFAQPIANGTGFDFCIFENAFSDTYLELAFVEVSSDGERFVRFPAISLTSTDTQVGPFGALDATKVHNLAGKYRQGYGTPFDLDDLADSSGIDLNAITHVRIVDVVGSVNPDYGTVDAQGNLVNDLFPTPFYSGGFDLDAVGVIHQAPLSLGKNDKKSTAIVPNPNSGVFQFLIPVAEIQSYEVFDALGRVCAVELAPQSILVHLHETLPQGLYVLSVRTANGTYRERFFLQR